VPPDAWPDNPEFLTPEMEVADCLAHIRDVDRPLSKGRALPYPSCAWKISRLQAGVSGYFESSSGNCSLNYAFVVERSAAEREFASDFFRTNSSYPSEKIWR